MPLLGALLNVQCIFFQWVDLDRFTLGGGQTNFCEATGETPFKASLARSMVTHEESTPQFGDNRCHEPATSSNDGT